MKIRISKIRESKYFKGFALLMAIQVLTQTFAPTVSFALTSGPAQEEFASFEPAATSDLVDLFSGDFTYNIPIMNVPGPNGGYPINLAYHGGIGMEQEASWVGLGWNINVGAINRQVQGIPDDFNGDDITYKMHMKESWEVGISADLLNLSGDYLYEEYFGIDVSTNNNQFLAQANTTIYYNNYKGLGYRISVLPKKLIFPQKNSSLSLSMGISFDSQNGFGFPVTGGLKTQKYSTSIGINISSRYGLNSLSVTGQIESRKKMRYIKNGVAMQGVVSSGMSSGIGFGQFAQLPNVSIPTKSYSTSFSLKLGTSTNYGRWEADNFDYNGYLSTSKVANKGNKTVNAYGYIYEKQPSEYQIIYAAVTNKNVISDISRESNLQSNKTPYLNPSRSSYDHFVQTAQGSGGSFRANRNYIQIYSSYDENEKVIGNNFGLELAKSVPNPPPSTFKYHVGLDYEKSKTDNSTGDWNSGTSSFDNDIENENTEKYFKFYGEHSGVLTNETNLNNWQNDEALLAIIEKDNQNWLEKDYQLSGNFSLSNMQTGAIPADQLTNTKTTTRRSNVVDYLTVQQAEQYGLYREGDFNKPGHLISEVQVLNQDGMRYVYGQAAYNNMQLNVTMSVNDGQSIDPTLNKNTNRINVNWDTYTDDANAQSKEYLNQDSIPTYAHSWLLTSVLSPDYIDSDDIAGPSDGDFGYWTKFNYVKHDTNFKWRTPYSGATFLNGSEGNPNDDMANFSYGEKEIYYVESIETKTHIAIFELSDRKDGLEALDKYAQIGQKGSTTSKKIDKIKLYTKAEYYDEYGAPNVNAIPLQIAHFEYNYDLCQGIHNNSGSTSLTSNEQSNNGGKLTLKKVYFTYENSDRGEISPYVFNYGELEANLNPDYDEQNIDRWGSFKPNNQYTNDYPYSEYPYSEQGAEYFTSPNSTQVPLLNDLVEKSNAGEWCLRQVILPTGGIMNINYEKDDYAFVEEQKATRMFDIISIGNSANYAPSDYELETGALTNEAYFGSPSINPATDLGRRSYNGIAKGNLSKFWKDNTNNESVYRIYFKLEEPISDASSESQVNAVIKNDYVGDLNHIYFKTASILRRQGNSDVYKDFVSGYAKLHKIHINNFDYFGAAKLNSDDFNIGYITVEPVLLGEVGFDQVHPFRKAAIEHIRINRPEIAHDIIPNNGTPLNQVLNFVASTAGIGEEITKMIVGYNRWAYSENWGEYIELNGKSIIKLQDPNGSKIGGGDRVKSLTINDNWEENDMESYYGQAYDYTTIENGKVISSGVAYEPSIGKEESALIEYEQYSESTPLSSPYTLMNEKPLLNSFYPGEQVGYSKVTVRSIAPSEADKSSDLPGSEIEDNEIQIANSSAPFAVYEFFTGKDFPVYYDITDIDPSPSIVRVIPIPGFYVDMRVKKAKSQGYSIVLNDMSGKLKSTATYTRKYKLEGDKRIDVQGDLITKTEYEYFTQNSYNGGVKNRLNNTVKVVSHDGTNNTFNTAVLGETVDIHIDRNENKSLKKVWGINLNIDISIAPLGTIFGLPLPLPQFFRNEVSNKTITTNKIIHRSGILKSVKVTTDASSIMSENLAFDLLTGEPLLTKVYNDFEDPIYNLSIPAYTQYEGVGAAFERTNIMIYFGTSTTISSGQLNNATAADKLKVGDEIHLGSSDIIAHVVEVNPTSDYIKCIDENGYFINTSFTGELAVVRPVERNMLTAKVGGVSFQQLGAMSGTSGNFTFDDVINASAVELSDLWQTICDNCGEEAEGNNVNDPSNPFRNGVKGNWRVKSSYAYRDDRTNATNTQTDGHFNTFSQFNWLTPSSSNAKWIKGSEVTKFSPYGFELEEKDAIGRYSAAVYGYRNSIVKAIGANMRYNEMAFDGFEDYPHGCNDNHFRFDFAANSASAARFLGVAHTGSYSVRVNASSESVNTYVATEKEGCEGHETEFTPGGSYYYRVSNCDCVGKFAPTSTMSAGNQKYVVSVWVKENQRTDNYSGAQIQINDGTTTHLFLPSGRIIEGWQRIYGEFNIPTNLNSLQVKFVNTSNVQAYYDDLRLHPYDGNMVSYVYNQINYKLEAELDANNFATIYIYDEEGNLHLTKRETLDGIKTINEGRISTKKLD